MAGAVAWLVQPLYIVGEVLVAALAGVSYSVRDDTISALGAACAHEAAAGCSSAPAAMNAIFVAFGVLQAVGAIAWLGAGRRHTGHPISFVATLWLLAGSSSVAVGLVPLDRNASAHAMVALPVFVCQPVATLLHARLLAPSPALRTAGVVLGLAGALGAVAFGVLLGAPEWSGAAERLAVWPAKLWLALAAAASLRRRRAPARPAPRRRGGPGPGR